MKDSFNWDFSRVWPSRGVPELPYRHDASLRRMEVLLVSRWSKISFRRAVSKYPYYHA
jgi:hypothetical protein